MIVYVVKRRWFEKKDAAETYRKSLGLKPTATTQLSIDSRGDLCALLNVLCDPPAPDKSVLQGPIVQVVDEAFVAPELDIPDCVPTFLLSPEQRKIREQQRASQ